MSFFFPASYSTLSTEALSELLKGKYGLKSAQCQFLVRGVGDTYLVRSAEEKFILRVYRSSHRNLPQIDTEIKLLLAAKEAAVPVSYPIADLAGGMIQTLNAIEGPRHAVFFSYARGKAVKHLNDQQLKELGYQMARYHQVASTTEAGHARWSFTVETTLFQPLERLKPYFEENEEDYAWLQQTAQAVARKLTTMDTAAFSTGYCHFDLLPKNFHFEGDAITLFDFDFMGYGWLIYDLAGFWQYLQLEVYTKRMQYEQALHSYIRLIDSYTRQRPLSQKELETIPYLSLGFWLFYMGFHTTHDSFTANLQPGNLKAYTGFLRNLAEEYFRLGG